MNTHPLHGFQQAPSPWVVRWSPLVQAHAPILDVACGGGRHMRWFAERGHPVTGVDRDPRAIESAQAHGETVLADIESGPWPFAGRHFGGVIVTNYLWRPVLPDILGSVGERGVLIYETFAAGNETVGKPSRPDFLLQPGELLRVCSEPEWRVISYENGFQPDPDRFVQRLVAVRRPIGMQFQGDPVERYPLQVIEQSGGVSPTGSAAN